MRKKVVAVIIAFVVALTAANSVIGIFLAQNNIHVTMDQNFALARDLASDLISNRVNLLKSDAATTAARFLSVASTNQDLRMEMEKQLRLYPSFLGYTVFDHNGVVATVGSATAEHYLREKYIQTAFEGQPIISTTRIEEETGQLVMHICVPMGSSYVLSTTIPGTLLTDLLAQYKFWDTGNLLLLDEDGVIIADGRYEYMVLERWSFIELAKTSTDPQVQSVAAVFADMLQTDKDIGRLSWNGVERYCIYTEVAGISEDWHVALMAPIHESPAQGAQNGLLIAAFLLLLIGVVIAILVSRTVARPYEKVEVQAKQLKVLNKTALEALEARSGFLANMSHEMRTPLNAIIGLSELSLGTDTLKGENRENTEKVYSAGMTLLSIVNDILDLSKFESGKFSLSEVEYDLPSLVNDTAIINSVRIGSKPIKFNIEVSEDMPARLLGDELRVKQMFTNLLSNAFKYTKAGEVNWHIVAEKHGSGYTVISTVSDTGIGIKPENLAKLYSDFNRMDAEFNRHIEGTGLGLSITRQLVEAMGGCIEVKSEYGKGSVFTLCFEQGSLEAPAIGAEIAEHLRKFSYVDRHRSRNLQFIRIKMPYARILVVDDVSSNLDVVRGILKPYEIQVDCVMEGQSAVERIAAGEPYYDAIFMDHMMPEMDGIEATQLIREIGTDYALNIPILALTANAIHGNEEMFLANGFQDFLSKPIDIMAMDVVLRKWVRDKGKEAELLQEGKYVDMGLGDQTGSAEDLADNTAADDAELDADTRRKLRERRCGYDRRAVKRLRPQNLPGGLFSKLRIADIDVEQGLRRFSDNQEIYLEVLSSYINSTLELLENLQACGESNMEKYAILMHGIKGSSRNIGAEAVSVKAEALERAARNNDAAYIRVNGEPFVKETLDFMSKIANILESNSIFEHEKPMRPAPDKLVLTRLKEACATFDMNAIDAAMDELRHYKYETDNDLIAWLAEQVLVMGFEEIVERLSADDGQEP